MQFLPNRGVTAPRGFQVGAARAGIKTQGLDLALLVADGGATCAGVFTTSQVKAAPVLVSAAHLSGGQPRAVVVNAGNANCCTGEVGLANARRMCDLAASQLGLDARDVLVCSTGIIGHPLPIAKIESALNEMTLDASDEDAARAFMTTDTVPKFIAAQTQIDGQTVTVGGQCKGVGMIGPNMAPLQLHGTMLAFLTTDAKIDAPRLQRLLESAVARSFNSVTVDGDMSTNDSAILLASGAAQIEITDENETEFAGLLGAVCIELAKKIARDGEGATRLIQIEVAGTATESDARRIALSIANSPLVKTAIFGRDPNWGRIAMAAGKAGVSFDAKQLSFSLGEVELFRSGEPVPFDQMVAEQQLADENVFIRLKLGEGTANWMAWTCDFSYDYVKINAEYHT